MWARGPALGIHGTMHDHEAVWARGVVVCANVAGENANSNNGANSR